MEDHNEWYLIDASVLLRFQERIKPKGVKFIVGDSFKKFAEEDEAYRGSSPGRPAVESSNPDFVFTVLDEAKSIVDGARQKDYGPPEDSFAQIAKYWSIYLSAENRTLVGLTAADVAKMMILLKLAREQNGHKRDNLTDVAGYAYCLDLIEEGKRKKT